MQLYCVDWSRAWFLVRNSDHGAEYPGHLDADGFEKPCCLLLRWPEDFVSYGSVIEQFDRQPFPYGTGCAWRSA